MLGKKPIASTLKDFKASEYDGMFEFIGRFDVGKVSPWFAKEFK
jgi:hypothetical protein